MDSIQNALHAYVGNGYTAQFEKVRDLLNSCPEDQCSVVGSQGLVVYRGQEARFISLPKRMFSATTDKDIALSEFAGKNGCVWTIRLGPGIRYFDVAKILGARYEKPYEAELFIGEGVEGVATKTSADPCEYRVDYQLPAPVAAPPPLALKKRKVTLADLRARALESPLPTPFYGSPREGEKSLTNEDLKAYYLDERFEEVDEEKGGRRSRTRKGRRTQKMRRTRRNVYPVDNGLRGRYGIRQAPPDKRGRV